MKIYHLRKVKNYLLYKVSKHTELKLVLTRRISFNVTGRKEKNIPCSVNYQKLELCLKGDIKFFLDYLHVIEDKISY